MIEKVKYLNKVVDVKIKNNVVFQGVFIDSGAKWTLLQYIPVDYVLDGYVLISNHYISNIEIPDDSLIEEIVKLKCAKFVAPYKINLDDHELFFKDIQNHTNFMKIELKSHDVAYIGKVNEVKEKSIRIHLISSKCKWLDVETFLYKELRAIYIKEDYLDSLTLYLDKHNLW